MAVYKVFFKESVEKDLRLIPRKDIKKILQRIESLAVTPHPPGCEKLSDQDRYRLRQGRYRIIYSIQDEALTVWVIKVGHRKEIYR